MGNDIGPDSIEICYLTSIWDPIVYIRRSYDRLIYTMGFPILVRRHLYIESDPWPERIPLSDRQQSSICTFGDYILSAGIHSLKRKGRHVDDFFIIGCIRGCSVDNLRCSQWWKSRQHDNLSVSVLVHHIDDKHYDVSVPREFHWLFNS